MPNFFWRETMDRPLEDRFPEEVLGRKEWQVLVRNVLGMRWPPKFNDCCKSFDAFLIAINLLKDQSRLPCKAECRLFVSHRQADVGYAKRIAHLATRTGFGYWLDVEDPLLQSVNGSAIPSPAKEVLLAAIIEVALLNSSHIIATMTSNTVGSKWVPYELGRAKQRMILSRESASWIHLGQITKSDCGEYINLAEITTTEREIRHWLRRSRMTCKNIRCITLRTSVNKLGSTKPLPET